MKKRKLFCLIALTIVMAISTITGIIAIADISDYVWSDVNISENLFAGDTFTVPTVTVNDGEKDYATDFVLKFPNGKNYSDTDDNPNTESSFRLPYSGIYQLTYTASIGGKDLIKEVEFTVNEKLFSVSGADSSVSYTTVECKDIDGEEGDVITKSGLYVNLAAGDTFNYNKIVDLNDLPSIAKIIEFYTIPSTDRELDVSGITVILTDAYDENNKVEIKVKACLNAKNESWWDWTYLSACAPNAGQITTGYAKGANPEVQVDTIYGTGTYFSFYGSSFYKKYSILERTVSISYHDAEKIVYVGDSKVVDLDDPFFFSKLWSGFSSSKVLVSFVGNTYFKSTANILIKELCGQKLDDENLLSKDTEPEFTIDNNGVDLDNVVTVKGYKFPIFNVTAVDAYDGELPVSVKAFNGYYSSMKTELDIVDECFIANKLGVVTLEYSVKAYNGKVYKKLIDVEVKDEEVISAQFVGSYITTGKAGDIFKIADFEVHDNVGKVESLVEVVKDGKTVDISNGSFKAISTGEYTVKVTAKDIIGQTAIAQYSVSVNANNNPVFYGNAILPDYFIVGKEYTLPQFDAYDYSSGQEQLVQSKIYVNNTETTKFMPTEEGDITIKYQASTENGSAQKTYTAKAISVTKDANALNYVKYFKTVRLLADAHDKGVSFTAETNSSGGKATFINHLNAFNFSIDFVISPEKKNFSAVEFYLRDVLDDDNVIKISIDHNSYKAYVNGIDVGVTIDPKQLFDTTGQSAVELAYDGRTNQVSIAGKKLEVKNFNGFSGNILSLDIALAGVDGNASMSVRKICNQVLKSTIKKDNIVPVVAYNGSYNIYEKVNTEITVHSAVVTDVLNPLSECYLTVATPNGYAIATDGTVLNKVSISKDYNIKLEWYGTYTITYFAKDAADNYSNSNKVNITVIDSEAPVLSFNGTFPKTAKVGDTIKLPSVSAVDNIDTELKVVVIIYNTYSGLRKVLKDNEFEVIIPSSNYIITFMCMDKAGNTTRESFTIKVGG